jgi:hypothetical protein
MHHLQLPDDGADIETNGRVDVHDEMPGASSIRTVFSVDGSRYQRWQAELLAYSHRRVHQPGPLTRLWSATKHPTPFPGDTFRATPWSPHPLTSDDYTPFNKPAAIQQWLTETRPEEPSILLVDPDCVFLAPVRENVDPGRPISQPVSYMYTNGDPGRALVARHCRRPGNVQGTGLPTLIHRDDLTVLAPLWLAKTEAIRSDPVSRELAGWTAEMWGYMFAAAELGLSHELRDLCVWSTDNEANRPLLHYCYEAKDATGTWRWDKRIYQPWEPVSPPPPGTPKAAVALIDLLNECANKRQFCLVR